MLTTPIPMTMMANITDHSGSDEDSDIDSSNNDSSSDKASDTASDEASDDASDSNQYSEPSVDSDSDDNDDDPMGLDNGTKWVIDTPTETTGVDSENETNVGTTGVTTANDANDTAVIPRRFIRGRILNTGRKRPMEDEYQYFQGVFDLDDDGFQPPEKICKITTQNEYCNYINALDFIEENRWSEHFINDIILA